MFNTKAFLMCAAMGLAGFANAEPISYQGQLKDQGVAANGVYDFKFQLFNTEVGGTQLGVEQDAPDINVTDGLFRQDLEFGDVFNANDAWLRVFVRVGTSTGAFTELLPRQKITDVPKAAYATVAETALDSYWQVGDSSSIFYGDGVERVLVNRSAPINLNEFFGVHASTVGTAFGGMHISTNAGGHPFYGYVVGGIIKSYSYYAPGTDSWNLWVGGNDVFNIDSNGDPVVAGDMAAGSVVATGDLNADGNVIAGGSVSAQGAVTGALFGLTSSRTLTYSVSGDTFHSGSGRSFAGGDAVGGAYQTQSGQGWLMAPVNLPDGAVVTSVRISFLDNSTGDMAVALQARNFTGTLSELALIQSSGASVAVQTMTTTNIAEPVIDNSLRGYHLRVFSSFWPGNLLLRIFGVQIEYTVDEVQ
ncbi:MAG: hypothetical protein JKY96_02130 [Phycisphaerales bacterium]|nr:hypothetical protein [Phycisphaerales bacterium]